MTTPTNPDSTVASSRPLPQGSAIQDGAATHKRADPDAAHVVQRHGRGQWQMGNGVKPGAKDSVPTRLRREVHAGYRWWQRHATASRYEPLP
jgi:hypothetical protein